jgi:preprotein translocase subunit YajC
VDLLIILVLAVGAMWLMTSRTRKQQREALRFRDNLQAGQEVQTASGMLGTVVEVEDGVVTLESPSGSQTRWVLAAISRLVEPPVEDEDEDGTDEDVEDEWEDDEDVEQDADEVIGTIEVPDDLSTLPPARGEDAPEDEDKKKK